MKLFVIGNYKRSNTGAGGHYYSLIEMVNQISKYEDAVVFVFGESVPIAFSKFRNFFHIKTTLIGQELGLFKALQLIRKSNYKIDLVHAYDGNVSTIGMIIAKASGARFCLTKCGGPPPKIFFPASPVLFVFHPADVDHFSLRGRRYPQLFLLPNRVSPPHYDADRAVKLFGERQSCSFVVFRIGRIGSMYEGSIRQSIELVKRLNEIGFSAELKVIGYLENKDTLDRLLSISDSKVSFYTETQATVKASELLGYCDAVVGTGRGLLEALAAGRVVFFPVKNSALPCLLTAETFEFGFRDNFSERVVVPAELSKFTEPGSVHALLRSQQAVVDLKELSSTLYYKYFDSNAGAKRLLDVYQSLPPFQIKRYVCSMIVHRLYLFALGVANYFR